MSSIPVEILEHIIQPTSTQDQLSLCLTSKLFHSLAIRSLYRTILLRDIPRIVRFCKALISNPDAARAARSLSLVITRLADPPLQAFYALIAHALATTTNLRALRLLFLAPPSPISSVLSTHSVFPHLQEFTLSCSSPHPFLDFLRRHPHIRKLNFVSPCDGAVHDPSPPVSVSLPHLTSFAGPAYIIPTLATLALEHVNVLWDAGENDFNTILSYLRPAPLRVIDNTTLGWRLPLVQSIVTHCTQLTSLTIRNGFPLEGVYTTNDFLQALHDLLPLLPLLRDIALIRILKLDGPATLDDLDVEFENTVRWGDRCPKLLRCTLPSGVMWYRVRGPAWFPDGHALQEKWLMRTLTNGRYPIRALEILLEEFDNFRRASNDEEAPRNAGSDGDNDRQSVP